MFVFACVCFLKAQTVISTTSKINILELTKMYALNAGVHFLG